MKEVTTPPQAVYFRQAMCNGCWKVIDIEVIVAGFWTGNTRLKCHHCGGEVFYQMVTNAIAEGYVHVVDEVEV
jgi:hypothetical protein